MTSHLEPVRRGSSPRHRFFPRWLRPFENVRGQDEDFPREGRRQAPSRGIELLPTFHFAGVDCPLQFAKHMFCCVGAPRHGKTLLLKLLALSALATIAGRSTRRAVFYDFKREYSPWLSLLVPPRWLKCVEPFHPDTVAWAIARDIQDVDQAEAMGKLLAPVHPDTREPFFDETVGGIFAGVLISLHLRYGPNWTLFDLYKALQSTRAIHETLAFAPAYNAWRIEEYLKAKQPNRDVLTTLGNRVQGFAAVARRWENASEAISLSQWMENPFVLVLGHSHQHAEATTAIRRAMFGRLSQLLLDEPDYDTPQSWLFFDELPSAGRLDMLPELLSKGPSRGVVAALGFQDISSLRHNFGPDLAQAISSFCGFKAFVRINDPETAEWASKHFGESDVLRHFVGRSWTDGRYPSSTVSVSPHMDRCRVVTPLELMSIPPLCPPEVTSLGSYVISPPFGRYRYELTLDTIERYLPRVPAPNPPRSQRPTQRPLLAPPTPGPEDDELPYL